MLILNLRYVERQNMYKPAQGYQPFISVNSVSEAQFLNAESAR